jgi:hypothetical protein
MMAKQFLSLTEDHTGLIATQQMFFVATAADAGRVNLSPKGMDSLRVLSQNRLIWLNLTGSGNETAGHINANPRMTVMWASFTKRPVILRCYGTARAVHPRDTDWADLYALFPASPGARQIYDLTIDLVQTSCGFAVPFYDHVGPRETLKTWAETQGEEGVKAYWETRNLTTMDGLPTGIIAND